MSAPRRALLSELTIGLLAWSDAWLWQYDPEDYPRAAAGLADLMLNGLSTEPFSFPEGQFADHPPGDTRDQLLAAATGLITGLTPAASNGATSRVVRAAQCAAAHQLSIWDAMMIESVPLAGCQTLWSEHLSDGAVVRGVIVRNPFAPHP